MCLVAEEQWLDRFCPNGILVPVEGAYIVRAEGCISGCACVKRVVNTRKRKGA